MDYVCKGNSLFQVFCKELHCICNLVFEGLRSLSPILEIKPVKWLRPVLGWKWLREFRYVNSCIKPSSLFLSADVNGEILFVPCCWKYFCISAHQVTIKLLLLQNVSVWLVFFLYTFTMATSASLLWEVFYQRCQSNVKYTAVLLETLFWEDRIAVLLWSPLTWLFFHFDSLK